ncbi:MAG: malonyl-CoA synthetase [marine bacterium B5-7]|nr:MAG: malonyl-CoA synthetase [marine bacterium B5-7]
MSNLYALFEERFSEKLTKNFIITEDNKTYSYQDLLSSTSQIAYILNSYKLSKGDRVIFQVKKSPEAIFLYLACLKLGLVSVPLNTSYTASELSYFVNDIEPSIVICDPESPLIKENLLTDKSQIHLLTLDSAGKGSLTDTLSNDACHDSIANTQTDDTACILYTSGTTGKPKGAMITHENLASNAITLHQSWGFNENDILLHALPIFHVHGLFVALNCTLLSASTMIFLEHFDIDKIIQNLSKATVLMGVPTYYARLLSHPGFTASAYKNMRLFISGSAPLLKEVSDNFFLKTGHRVLERYGMTETVMIASNPLNGDRVPGSVGPALPGITVRITADDGTILAKNETGNIQVSGPNVFNGYWRKPDKTEEEFTNDGFFKTGDVGFLNNHDYLTIIGRSKDLIISGGYNVYPKEIENIINDYANINESAVIGVPHPDFGEGVIAVVVMESGEKENFDAPTLIKFLKQHLASYKVPKFIFEIEKLPINVMGKVQKNVLRDQFRGTFERQTITN